MTENIPTTDSADNLRAAYRRLLRVLKAERTMRLKVFPEGDSRHASKLAEIDGAISDLKVLGEALREIVNLAEPEQLALLDVTRKGGY